MIGVIFPYIIAGILSIFAVFQFGGTFSSVSNIEKASVIYSKMDFIKEKSVAYSLDHAGTLPIDLATLISTGYLTLLDTKMNGVPFVYTGNQSSEVIKLSINLPGDPKLLSTIKHLSIKKSSIASVSGDVVSIEFQSIMSNMAQGNSRAIAGLKGYDIPVLSIAPTVLQEDYYYDASADNSPVLKVSDQTSWKEAVIKSRVNSVSASNTYTIATLPPTCVPPSTVFIVNLGSINEYRCVGTSYAIIR